MKLTVHRCLKKPGLIIRAKTYFLELNTKGLYIVALGNAAMMPPPRSVVHEVVGKAAFNHFDKKYEAEILANEQKIELGQLDELAATKYSYFLRKEDVQQFKVSSFHDAVRVDIKGGKAKITLFAHPEYMKTIHEMAKALNHI